MIIAGAFLFLLVLPFYLVGLKWWASFWFAVALVLGIYELVAKDKKGHTLSQLFWHWREDNPKKGWWLLAGMLTFWTVLMVHLYWVK